MSRMDRIWVQRSKVNVLSKGQRILVHVKSDFKKKASLTRHYIIIWRIIKLPWIRYERFTFKIKS